MQIVSLLISLCRFLRVIIILETVGASQLWIDIYYPPPSPPPAARSADKRIQKYSWTHSVIYWGNENTKRLNEINVTKGQTRFEGLYLNSGGR